MTVYSTNEAHKLGLASMGPGLFSPDDETDHDDKHTDDNCFNGAGLIQPG